MEWVAQFFNGEKEEWLFTLLCELFVMRIRRCVPLQKGRNSSEFKVEKLLN